MRRLTLYRDDSTTQVVYDNVKHYFWLAGNTVLSIAVVYDPTGGEHYYVQWPRERFCWFKDEPMPFPDPALDLIFPQPPMGTARLDNTHSFGDEKFRS
jgi:hypothetical protein